MKEMIFSLEKKKYGKEDLKDVKSKSHSMR